MSTSLPQLVPGQIPSAKRPTGPKTGDPARLAARTSPLWAGIADPARSRAGLTRRPDSDAGRPLAGPGRARRPAPAWPARGPAAATRGESHPGPVAASWPSSGGLRNVLDARRSGGSDP